LFWFGLSLVWLWLRLRCVMCCCEVACDLYRNGVEKRRVLCVLVRVFVPPDPP
jgi:hypothetical protein